jgi:geranyl-CoA carboxylase alpha subunit
MKFDKVLIANRGEIAVRIIRGCKKLGYRTVAVYSEADRNSLHVGEADEAVCIGPAPARESYLVIENILQAARATGAGAIHPGYGFLSEREAFSAAVQEAGLTFIGPDPFSIEAMGNKSASKIRMIAAGVPCVPGYQGDDQSDATLVAEAKKAGLPVMVKAAAGGGGRGMRLVHDEADLLAGIQSARSEASNAFGDGQLLIEKAVLNARHVEIQVFGDRHGNVVHLGERDCSVQRRNQKVVEEAPSPAVDEDLRARMGAAAVAAAKAVNYVGAGTVEFMLAADGAFYFLEMNTRLQVEHPVTELVYDVDLVEWQLRVAQGEPLPMTQEAIDARRKGWAIEVRLCTEGPGAEFHAADRAAACLARTGGGRHARRSRPAPGRRHFAVLRFDAGQADRGRGDA